MAHGDAIAESLQIALAPISRSAALALGGSRARGVAGRIPTVISAFPMKLTRRTRGDSALGGKLKHVFRLSGCYGVDARRLPKN
jgi:hypothetical protein